METNKLCTTNWFFVEGVVGAQTFRHWTTASAFIEPYRLSCCTVNLHWLRAIHLAHVGFLPNAAELMYCACSQDHTVFSRSPLDSQVTPRGYDATDIDVEKRKIMTPHRPSYPPVRHSRMRIILF
jgi:hypothetical protein